MNTRTDSSEKANAKKDTHTETTTKEGVATPMADDKTLKTAGATPERRRAVPTVSMKKDRITMDVSALDVEAHARMGWKVASEG